MTTIVFVHGIAVRDQNYPEALPGLRERLTESGLPVELRFCFWGAEFGARLPAEAELAGRPEMEVGGPWQPTPKPTAPASAGADVDALWALLDEDPLFELRVIAAGAEPPNFSPHRMPRGKTLEARARELPGDARLGAALADAGLREAFSMAVSAVLDAWVVTEALARAEAPSSDVPAALARALVAAALANAGSADYPFPLTRGTVDHLVAEVTHLLGPSHLGVRAQLGRFVVAGLSPLAIQRRDGLTRRATRYAGDVAKYLSPRWGPRIRGAIRASVDAARPPVVLLGHSLGGVACVDLLASPGAPTVRALVTVGSQASYFYRIDTLPSLERGKPLPDGFPRWINVHDERDLLSFPAADAFGDHVEDRVVDNGMRSIDLAHRAYFSNPQLTPVLRDALR